MSKERKSRKETKSVSKDVSEKSHETVNVSGEVLSRLCQELRAPLNLSMELADLLKGSLLTDDQAAGVNVIRHANQFVLDRLNDVNTLVKAESGTILLEILDFDLLKLMEHATEAAAERALEKGAVLTTFVEPAIAPVLKGDPQYLSQIISNLAFNAVRYKTQGSIFIKAAPDESDAEHNRITFTVTETGTGLSQQEINWLVQPINALTDIRNLQADMVSHIGMRVAKCLIELMGGTFWVSGIPGKGTTIGFTLDLATGTDLTERHIFLEQLKDKRLLFANVEEIQLSILQQWASAYGLRHFAIDTLEHVPLAIQNATASGDPYSLALVDLSADGRGKNFEPLILRLLKSSETPVVFLRDIDDVDSEVKTLQYANELYMPVKQSDFISSMATFSSTNNFGLTADLRSSDASNHHNDSILNSQEAEIALLADDNRVNREVAKLILNKLGYQCTAVNGGQKALEELAQSSFAFIILDLQMPDLDGFETAKQIRQLEKDGKPRHRLIAVTANARPADQQKALEAGFDEFISKPVTAEKLARAIGQWHSF